MMRFANGLPLFLILIVLLFRPSPTFTEEHGSVVQEFDELKEGRIEFLEKRVFLIKKGVENAILGELDQMQAEIDILYAKLDNEKDKERRHDLYDQLIEKFDVLIELKKFAGEEPPGIPGIDSSRKATLNHPDLLKLEADKTHLQILRDSV